MKLFELAFFTLLLFFSGVGYADESIILSQASAPQLFVEKNINLKPDSDGYILKRRIDLPSFIHGCYYRPFSGGGHVGPSGNRVEAISFDSLDALDATGPKDETVNTAKINNNLDLGQFVLLELTDHRYLVIMPLVTKEIMSAFFIEEAGLFIKSGNLGTEVVSGDVPMFVSAVGDSPYEATHKIWKKTLASGWVHTDWRSNKSYPEMYEYLGWCSWEHYRLNINTENMTEAVHVLEENSIPFRWFMVDDGYLNHENRRLINFDPESNKFPGGWQDITALKNPDGIRWMGLWRNMMGYMAGVSKDQNMQLAAGTLVNNARSLCMVPNGSKQGSQAFYEEMISKTKAGGFDFAKVDFQSSALYHQYGMENPIRANHYNHMALEEACEKHLDGLLNCIAQTHVNVFNTKISALTRSSRDYGKSRINSAITYQSFANHLWLGQVVWGDMDMFHSHGKDADALTIARAISGGPVYISDEPTKIVEERLFPFCDLDGKVFRADAPAVLLPESYFIKPFSEGKAFRVIAPTKNKVAAFASFNFNGKNAVDSFVMVEDYTCAGEQIQPYSGKWSLPNEGLIVYDQKEQKVIHLEDEHVFHMPANSAKLFMIYPKTKGWAVIGRTDKYLSAATVQIETIEKKRVRFTMLESGPFAIWSVSGRPRMQGVTFVHHGDGLYLADIPEGKANEVFVIER